MQLPVEPSPYKPLFLQMAFGFDFIFQRTKIVKQQYIVPIFERFCPFSFLPDRDTFFAQPVCFLLHPTAVSDQPVSIKQITQVIKISLRIDKSDIS
jgi:hypothetical protein